MIDPHAPRSAIPRPTRAGFGVALLIALIAAFAIACTTPSGGSTAAPGATGPAAPAGTEMPPATSGTGY